MDIVLNKKKEKNPKLWTLEKKNCQITLHIFSTSFFFLNNDTQNKTSGGPPGLFNNYLMHMFTMCSYIKCNSNTSICNFFLNWEMVIRDSDLIEQF